MEWNLLLHRMTLFYYQIMSMRPLQSHNDRALWEPSKSTHTYTKLLWNISHSVYYTRQVIRKFLGTKMELNGRDNRVVWALQTCIFRLY